MIFKYINKYINKFLYKMLRLIKNNKYKFFLIIIFNIVKNNFIY